MVRLVQTNFSAGEISRRASVRHDREFFYQAAAKLENLHVMIEGGVTRRGGSPHVASPKNHDKKARLIPFVKSNEDVVMLEFGENYVRFFDVATRAQIMDGPSPKELLTSYAESDIDALYEFQSANVMFLTCKNGLHEPRAIRRFEDIDDWDIINYAIKSGPFQAENLTAITLLASAEIGTITITATGGAVFEAGHVGARYRIYSLNRGVPFKKWEAEEVIAAPDTLRAHEGRVYNAAPGTGSNQPPVHESGTASDGLIDWTYFHDLQGVARITGFTNATTVAATVEERMVSEAPPIMAPTPSWAEGYFSDAQGWPFVGGIFQGRLFFSGAPNFPDTLWASRIDGFNASFADFKQSAGGGEVLDDDAVVRTLSDGEVNRISWLLAGEQVLLGHKNGIVRVTGPSLNEPITPAGASASRPEPPPGAYFDARGIRAGDSVIYASASGRKIIALDPVNFQFQTLTSRARDKEAVPFKSFAYLSETVNRLYALREDGALYACAFDREQQLVAWSTIILGGNLNGDNPQVESIAKVRGPDKRDELWMIVKRTIGGALKRSIEVMALDFDGEEKLSDEAVFADASKVYDQWNKDETQTILLTAVGGIDAALRDSQVTLNVAGFTFDATWIGREVRLRRKHAPLRNGDAPGEVACVITAQFSTKATATLLSDATAPALYGVALYQWAQAISVLSGLDHLDGETVEVWGDGADLGSYVVAAGAIDISTHSIARGCAGYNAGWVVRSLPLVFPLRDGISKGANLRAWKAIAELIDFSPNGASIKAVVDKITGEETPIGPRDDQDVMTLAAGLRDDIFTIPIGGGPGKRVEIEITGKGLGPASVLSAGIEAET